MALNDLDELFNQIPTPADKQRKGELVIAGTGIASVRQITLETLQYIRRADSVFYLVCDATAEAFIQENAKNHHDLYQLYDKDKSRLESYIQMAELMLRKVRQGELVVGLFYGHPGVFANPSHRAVQIAREEGYKAKMLPGVSADACLFADLGIDPSTPGCVSYEATSMLYHDKTIDTSNHLILWQVGGIGKSTMAFENDQFHFLVKRLETHYGPDHPVIHYLAGTRPLELSSINRYSICDLYRPEVAKAVHLASTFYIPPKTLPSVRTTLEGEAAGTYVSSDPTVTHLQPTSAFRLSHPEMKVYPSYGSYELAAIQKLDNFTPPAAYTSLPPSPGMRRIAIKLALNHHKLRDLSDTELVEFLQSKELEDFQSTTIAAVNPDMFETAMRDLKDLAHPMPGPRTALYYALYIYILPELQGAENPIGTLEEPRPVYLVS